MVIQQYAAFRREPNHKRFNLSMFIWHRVPSGLGRAETLSLILFQTSRSSGGFTMGIFLRIFSLLAVALLLSAHGFALSVRQYENKTKAQGAEAVASAIDKIVDDVAKVNPALSKSIHDYFYVIPAGQAESPGLIAFGAELVAVENLADKGKLDLDKVQVEGILLDLVKTDVMKKQSSQNNQAPAKK